MRIIMVAAISQDGFLTKGDDPNPSNWTSEEDKAFFADIKSKHQLFVIGSKTYIAGKIHPNFGTLRIILTEKPQEYQSQTIPGQLEFAKLTPQEFKDRYKNNYESCLVLGGSYVYSSFLESGLIDEIYLTIEPILNFTGIPLLSGGKKLESLVDLPKPKETILNNSGTTLLHYILS